MSLRQRIATWLLAETPNPDAESPIILDERIGYDGQEYNYGEWSDHNTDLATFAQRMAKYDEMRIGHAAIVAQFESLLEPVMSGTWTAEVGPGLPLELGEPEDEMRAETAAEHIRANMLRSSSLREYRMQTTFKQFLGELFTAEEFGFSIFEKQHRMQDGLLGTLACYDKVAWIQPKSLKYIHVGEDGGLLGVTQDWTSDGYFDDDGGWHTHSPPENADTRWGGVFIPADRLFVHTRRKEGDKVEGRPMSRGMYGAYKRQTFYERAEVINAQKRAIGIPYYKMAKDTPKENLDHAMKQVKGMRSGNERQVVVTQGDDEIGFVDMTANSMDLEGPMRRTNSSIAAVAGTEFKRLGQDGAGGSLALGEVLGAHFNLHIEAIAESMREAIQLGLIEPLHELNFADVTPPQLRVEDITPPDLAPIVQAKSTDLLGPWRGVDAQSIRDRLKLAPLSQEEIEQMDEMAQTMRERLLGGEVDEDGNPIPLAPGQEPGEPGEDDEGGTVPGKGRPQGVGKADKDEGNDEPDDAALAELAELDPRTPPTFGREPTRFERRVVKLEEVNLALHQLGVGLAAELRTARDVMIDEAVGKLKFVNGDPDISRLRLVTVGKPLERAAKTIRTRGKADMRSEAEVQLRALVGDDAKLSEVARLEEFASVTSFEERLNRVIKESMTNVETRVRGDVIGEVIRALETGSTVEEAKEIARMAAKARSAAPLSFIARGIVSRAYNLGRVEEAETVAEEVVEEYENVDPSNLIRSEIFDHITCDPCRRIYDGMVLPLGSDRLDANAPPGGCLGGDHCRGVLLMVLGTEEEAERVREEVGLPTAREDLRFLRVGQRRGDDPLGRFR